MEQIVEAGSSDSEVSAAKTRRCLQPKQFSDNYRQLREFER